MTQITISKQPINIDEFIALRNQIAITPVGGAAMFLLALKIYVQDNIFGHQCLVATADSSCLWEGDVYKGFMLNSSDFNLMKSQYSQNPKIPDSYIEGAVPENNYESKLPYKYNFTSNSIEGEYAKLFVICNGADSPRPIHVKKNDKGLWEALNYSTMFVGIKKPPFRDEI